ncbi:MAG: M18 family aminopeptidase [Clostridia bacterium]
METNYVNELFGFLKNSPSMFHAIDVAKKTLIKNGFVELNESEAYKIERGGKYFVTRNMSSIIAFSLPKDDFSGFMVVASHSDSPTFKLKSEAEIEVNKKYIKLDTEKYGGMLMASWFDRPLSIAGKVVVKTETGVKSVLINIDRDLVIIPNLAIHMSRDANDGYKFNAAKDTYPLFSEIDSSTTLNKLIAETAGVDEENVLGRDIYLYNRMGGTVFGANGEFIAAPRIDDLQCAFSSLTAIVSTEPNGAVPVCYIADNEEVGSGTKQGAAGTFLFDTLSRINEAFGGSNADYQIKIAQSFMLSADNAHAVHPNYTDVCDPKNAPYLNGGIAIKYNGSQKYATDAVSEGIFKNILNRAGVKYQPYANRSDMPGGSTLGNISATRVPMNTVDIGIPQLAMHSAYETAGTRDMAEMIAGMRACFESNIKRIGDGEYIIG